MRNEKGKYFDCNVGAIVSLRVFLDIDIIVFFGLHDSASHYKVKEDIEAQCTTDYIEWQFFLYIYHAVKKEDQPASSINDISAMHTSTNLKGFKNGISCNLCFLSMSAYLSFSIRHLLQHVAIQSIKETAIDAAENGNI